MMSYSCACMCACMHVHVGGVHPLTTPHPHPKPYTHPPSPGGDPRNHSKFNSTWTNWDISILFEDLKSAETSPTHEWVYNLVGGWVGWWVGSGEITKNLKIVDWIKIIQFCLKIYDLWRHPHPLVGVSGWVDGWVNGWGQVKWLKI